MASKLFNSTFETELRILCLLTSMEGRPIETDGIVALDFIVCYSNCFRLPSPNLHGKNDYMYGELSNRRRLTEEAIRSLVKQGLIKVNVSHGFTFAISPAGKEYAMRLESQYARDYRETAKAAVDKYGKYGEDELIRMIQNNALKALKGVE